MKKLSKRLKASTGLVDHEKRYTVKEAVEILKKVPAVKFDETVQIAIKLNVDPKKPEQNLRGAFSLPNGSGKTVRVIAFCEGDKAKEAETAGAVSVGGQDLVQKILDGWMDFDVAIAHPSMMKFVGKLGRVLGTKGLMPSPKSGTVSEDVGRAVKEFRAGKIEYRTDSAGNIHAILGKKSFEAGKIEENAESFISMIQGSRPPTVKGIFISKMFLTTTMGVSVPLKV